MQYKASLQGTIYRNKKFIIFLIGQGISNLGDAFHLIAVTSLLVNVTGYGLSAAFGLICYPILSILFSALAGYICDIKKDKLLLVILDLLRGLSAILFILCRNILEIYIMIAVLSLLDIFYGPPRRKFITKIIKTEQIIKGNSLLGGLSGGAFIIGPILAGYIISYYSKNTAFILNSLSFFLSALSIGLIKVKESDFVGFNKIKSRQSLKNSFKPVMQGFLYCRDTYILRKIISIGTLTSFAITSVNIAFYPFVFDVLRITDSVWGMMMSVFYGSNLLAMQVSIMFDFNSKGYFKAVIPFLLITVSAVWFLYGNISNVGIIMFLQLLEGTALSYLSIILASYLQIKSKISILGRVAGINDFVNNLGKVLGIGFTYALLGKMAPYAVFLCCALIVFIFGLFNLVTINSRKLESGG